MADTPTGERGTVVSAVRVAHMSPEQVRDYLADFHPDFASPKPVNGVDTYRVVYRTISARGRATTASGVVSLPSRKTKSPLRAVSFTHGTHAAKNIAGSVAGDGQSRVAAVYYAGAGYAGVAPDYLGLGLGPGFHPYGHAASEASASLDMLRAARAVAESHGRRLRREVFVTGFSQGGQAAMALGRELQRGADRYLRLGALAPVSGPYDVRRAQIPESFRPGTTLNAKTSVFYTAYLMVTWHRLYGLYDSPSEVFQAPYDGTVEKLFDGSGDFEEIGPHLPDSLDALLTPRFRQRLLHPSGTVLRAMRDMDGTCDWRPQVPTRLHGASGDEQVTYANTGSCVRALRERGARPATADLKTDHFGTLFRGLPATLRWFRSLS
ncbi:alpha/beta hydrolase family protein [Spirillospora sp. NPDC048911]|uniref:alpha/beta hydrolase family protein n=1 Tax=Spirillospora sp. NPDC048911 TaxID=3364527 RepID=UPI0037240393